MALFVGGQPCRGPRVVFTGLPPQVVVQVVIRGSPTLPEQLPFARLDQEPGVNAPEWRGPVNRQGRVPIGDLVEDHPTCCPIDGIPVPNPAGGKEGRSRPSCLVRTVLQAASTTGQKIIRCSEDASPKPHNGQQP